MTIYGRIHGGATAEDLGLPLGAYSHREQTLKRFLKQHPKPKDLDAEILAWLSSQPEGDRGLTRRQVVRGKSRGLGDTVAKLTHATGLDRLAKLYSKKTGKDCGCSRRQSKLNQLFPYR